MAFFMTPRKCKGVIVLTSCQSEHKYWTEITSSYQLTISHILNDPFKIMPNLADRSALVSRMAGRKTQTSAHRVF